MSRYFNNASLLKMPFDRCISRLQYKPDLFYFSKGSESLQDLLNLNISNLTWEQCCEKRALQLLALKKEQYHLYYSGGIDSTVALVSMLKFWPNSEHKKIHLQLSHSSIEENLLFFKKFGIHLHLKSAMTPAWPDGVNNKKIFISGDHGDQMFGSDILGHASRVYGDTCLFQPYKDWAIKILEIFAKRPHQAHAIFERLEPIVYECPFPIRNTHDFFWWFNFSQKWQYVKYRFLETDNWDLTAQYGTHILHFFDTLDFQKWSLSNHDLKIQKSWSTYKFTAKNFIYDFTQSKQDLNLLKVPSLGNLYFLTRKRIAIKEDYTEINNNAQLQEFIREQP